MDLSRSSFQLFLSKSGRAILMFGGIVYFGHQLDSTQMGSFFLFFALQGLLAIPGDLGIRGALEKRLSEGTDASEFWSSALAFKLALLCVVAVVALAARGYIDDYLGSNLAGLLVVAFVLRELSLLYINAIRGDLRVGETAPIEFARRFTWVSIGVVLVTLGFGVRGIVYGLICSSTVVLILAHRKSHIPLTKPTLAHIRSLFAFSKYDTIKSVGDRVYQWMDTAIIGLFLAHQYVSAYELAWQVTLIVLLLSKSISLTLFPQISQWNAESSNDRIESTISTALGFATFASIPAVVGAAIYSKAIMHFVFGPEYTIAALVLVVIMVEKVFQSFNDIFAISIRAIDRPDLAARATVVSVGLNLILSPLFLLWMGFVGVAIATTIAWFSNMVLHMRYLSRFMDLDVPYWLIGWYTVASLGMGVVLLSAKSVLPVTNVLLLIGHIGLGAIVYGLLSFAIPDIRRQIIAPGLELFDIQLTR